MDRIDAMKLFARLLADLEETESFLGEAARRAGSAPSYSEKHQYS